MIPALSIVLAVSSASAEPLGLAEAQAEARSHAPDVATLRARVRGARAVAAAEGRALQNPSVGARYATAVGDARGSWGVGVEWPIDVSGSWALRGESAAADAERAALEREDGLRALDESVAIAFAEVAAAARRLARAEKVVALRGEIAEAARRELAAGSGNQLDLDAAEIDLGGAAADRSIADGDLAAARFSLARLLGRADASGISVSDAPEGLDVPTSIDVDRFAAGDPRVRAAFLDLRAARLARRAEDRALVPAPTIGADVDRVQQDVPAGAFAGGPPGLRADWSEWEVGVHLTVPLPLFDRRRPERARATARVLEAEARLAEVRATVRAELSAAHADLRAAAAARTALAPVEAALDRDLPLLERSVRAGATNAVQRALLLSRLEEAGRRVDEAVRDLRVARARWIRRSRDQM